MKAKNKIEKIMEESKKMFIRDQKSKFENIIMSLFRYRLYKDKECLMIIKNFFHSLKGTGATLQLDKLSQIGYSYEDYIEKVEDKKIISDKIYSKLLQGLGQAYEEIGRINKRLLTDEEIITVEVLDDTEYTNITRNGNILIVDDDIAMLNHLGKSFQQEGYYVIITSKPKEVKRIIEKRDIDLILLDIMMPEMDGFEVLEEIKNINKNIPVIFLTGKNFTEDKVEALRKGVDDYITKPFETKEVIARVDRALQRLSDYKNSIIEDELTGAYTKKYFKDRIKKIKERVNRLNEKFSVAFVDIDYFKEINDTYGHLTGDIILKKFSKGLMDNLRETDEVYRFGGDEFLALFPSTECKEAFMALERFRKNINEKGFYIEREDKNIPIAFSAGIATIIDKNETIEELLERADQTLYKVKETGRGRVLCYKDSEIAYNRKKKILVVDDERVIVKIIKTRLNTLNYDVFYASNGDEGLKLANEIKPDLVIIDIMMPKVNGYEMSKEIKQNTKTTNTKIIILSSKKKDDDIRKGFETGADDYMTKPFSLSELEIRIKKLLKNR